MVQTNITLREREKGNWQYIISYKDEMGKWKQKGKQGFKKKTEAKGAADTALEKLRDELAKMSEIIDEDYDSVTFETVTDKFMKHSTLHKEFNTVKGYRTSASKFKDLNNMKIKDIKKADIQECIDQMVRQGLKTSTLDTNIRRIKLIFDYYRENYDPNYKTPMNNLVTPKEKETATKKALTKKEMEKLLKQLANSKHFIVAYLAGTCGLRCGEILGLTWDDIDENNMNISINKQWKKLGKGKNGFGALKSKNSKRFVPISENILKTLGQYRKNNPIRLDKRIAPWNEATITKYLNYELNKLAGISLHELRHTYATLLISNGVDFKTAAGILGHDIAQTMATYSHVTDDMMRKASSKIKNIF